MAAVGERERLDAVADAWTRREASLKKAWSARETEFQQQYHGLQDRLVRETADKARLRRKIGSLSQDLAQQRDRAAKRETQMKGKHALLQGERDELAARLKRTQMRLKRLELASTVADGAVRGTSPQVTAPPAAPQIGHIASREPAQAAACHDKSQQSAQLASQTEDQAEDQQSIDSIENLASDAHKRNELIRLQAAVEAAQQATADAEDKAHGAEMALEDTQELLLAAETRLREEQAVQFSLLAELAQMRQEAQAAADEVTSRERAQNRTGQHGSQAHSTHQAKIVALVDELERAEATEALLRAQLAAEQEAKADPARSPQMADILQLSRVQAELLREREANETAVKHKKALEARATGLQHDNRALRERTSRLERRLAEQETALSRSQAQADVAQQRAIQLVHFRATAESDDIARLAAGAKQTPDADEEHADSPIQGLLDLLSGSVSEADKAALVAVGEPRLAENALDAFALHTRALAVGVYLDRISRPVDNTVAQYILDAVELSARRDCLTDLVESVRSFVAPVSSGARGAGLTEAEDSIQPPAVTIDDAISAMEHHLIDARRAAAQAAHNFAVAADQSSSLSVGKLQRDRAHLQETVESMTMALAKAEATASLLQAEAQEQADSNKAAQAKIALLQQSLATRMDALIVSKPVPSRPAPQPRRSRQASSSLLSLEDLHNLHDAIASDEPSRPRSLHSRRAAPKAPC
jgi:hypothetical protein